MEGVFIRKKRIWQFLTLLCGCFLIGLYIFLQITDPEDSEGLITIPVAGILICLVTVPSILFNRGAFIHIEENRISAKYHLFGRLACHTDEIAFVLPQLNTLTILLKDGKRHTIMGIENPWALAYAIRTQCFSLETEPPFSLQEKLSAAQTARKKLLYWCIGSFALMLAGIFITVLLTGDRDLNDFSTLDWTIFGIMGFAELATLIIVFLIAHRCGKSLLPIQQLKYRLRGAVIATQPLPENTITVYTDENYSSRIVVCGFPNYQAVYYCVQKFATDITLETVYTSETYDNQDALPDGGFDGLIDITKQMQKH